MIRLKILEAREQRIKVINNLLKKNNKFIVTIKANICGNDKNITETSFLLKIFLKEVLTTFKIYNYEKISSIDGNYYIVEIENTNVIEIKKSLINLENSNLGRLIDLDLYTGLEKSITRSDLNIESRKCIVCGNNYYICAREQKHTIEEVLNCTKNIVKSYIVNIVLNETVNSLKKEVFAHPKFGLVTKKSSGKHSDMDYNLFINSIETLKPHLKQYLWEGFCINNSTFFRLRKIGIEAEKSMFQSTKGINTYKGAIFLLGIVLPSIVNVLYNDYDFNYIEKNIKFLSKNILEDFKTEENESYGKKLYKKYGVLGIRGEAYKGLPVAFGVVNTFYNCVDNDNTKVINILLYVMERLEDTVVLHRSNELDYVKKVAKEINSVGGYSTEVGKQLVHKYTDEFIAKNISPGGSADIVIVSLILLYFKRFMEEHYVL